MSTHPDRKNGAGLEESGGTGASADLHGEGGGVEERELNGLEDRLNLLPLGGDDVFS